MNVTGCKKSTKKLEKKSTQNGIGKRTRSCEDDYLKCMEMGQKLIMVSAHQINLHALNFFTYFCVCIKPFSVQSSLCQLEYFFYLFLLKIIV